jgi:hypothetical protein
VEKFRHEISEPSVPIPARCREKDFD